MYKNIYKDVSVDGYKLFDVIKNCTNFLKQMKKFKLYIVEFYNDGIIKPKNYLFDCAVTNKI